MKGLAFLLGVLLLMVGFLGWQFLSTTPPPTSEEQSAARAAQHPDPLLVYVAASNRPVFEAIREQFEKETGITIQVQYGASQSLLSAIEIARTGDLYLPADDSYLDLARQKKLEALRTQLASMQVVLVVAKGNPKGIKSLADLKAPGIRLVQGDPDAAAIGKLTRDALTRQGEWDALKERTLAFKTTVNDVANDISIGAADAGIVYDVVLRQYPDLEGVEIPELAGVSARVSAATLTTSKHPDLAIQLADFLANAEQGLSHYQRFGFKPVRVPGPADPVR